MSDRRQRHLRIRRERSVDVGFKRREINFDHAVVVLLGVGDNGVISLQVLGDFICHRSNRRAARGGEVALHRVVVTEDRGRGAHFRTHVADRGFAGGRQVLAAVAEVFNHAVRAALGGEDPGDLQNHVFGRSPAV